MKILAFSDIHSSELFLEKLQVYLKNNHFDLAVVAGDWEDYNRTSFIDDLITIFKNNKLPIYGVCGNVDSDKNCKFLNNENVSLHNTMKNFENYNLIGLNGSLPTPFTTNQTIEEKEIKNILGQFNIDNNTIIITHVPPYGYFDNIRNSSNHAGSHELLNIIKNKQPLLSISGHIHEHWGVKKMVDKTTIVNLPPAKKLRVGIINIKDKKIKVNFVSIGD